MVFSFGNVSSTGASVAFTMRNFTVFPFDSLKWGYANMCGEPPPPALLTSTWLTTIYTLKKKVCSNSNNFKAAVQSYVPFNWGSGGGGVPITSKGLLSELA